MMNAVIRKLKSRAGESLVESLLSILIFTLASIAMYSMVTTAADINMTVKEEEKSWQEQMVIAEQGEGTAIDGKIYMTMQSGGTSIQIAEIDVDVYGQDGDLFAYYAASGGSGG